MHFQQGVPTRWPNLSKCAAWSAALLMVSVLHAGPPRFEPASECAACHSKITSAGVNVAPFTLWLGSMMANAARDPYWKAKVAEETATHPAAAAVIEDKCLKCHAPAQQYGFRESKNLMRVAELNEMGSEGVTCTVCHQITPQGLGKPESFTGGFVIGKENQIFGPHANPFMMPMLHHTGYQPYESKHMLDSSLCGSCHTVVTPTLNARGEQTGEFLEQAPYLEWLASDFGRDGRSCQSCHMPDLLAESYIAHRPPGGAFPPTRPRKPFGRHFFVGPNVDGARALAAAYPDEAETFAAAEQRARDFLKQSLRLSGQAAWKDGKLHVTVDVENRSGHKLPTGFPSRRLWLRLQALDEGGKVLFASGAWDAQRSDIAASSFAHISRITRADEAIVYEARMGDTDGRETSSLLSAARYLKDNRLLPRGFTGDARIAPVGTDQDPDFQPGRDRVIYEVPGTPARIVVEALYQSIRPEFAKSAFGEEKGLLYSRPVVAATLELDVAR